MLTTTAVALVGTSAAQAAPRSDMLTVQTYLTDAPTQSPDTIFKRLRAGATPEAVGLTQRRKAITPYAVRRTGPASLRGSELHASAENPAALGTPLGPTVTDVPKRTMTLAECKAHTAADASMWIPSRFAMCESQWFAATWHVNGREVGFSQMTVSAIATVPANSREVHFDYYFSDFYAAGANAIDETLVGTSVNHPTVPSGVSLGQGGLNPTPTTVAQLKANPHFMISTNASPGQGLAPDDGIWAVWNMKFVPEWPPGWVETNPLAEWKFSSFGLRWDNSPYLPNYKPADALHSGGAALSYDVSPLRYSTAATAPERAVASHIETAFTQPQTTLPTNRSKHVAGQTASDPLHRLQKNISQTNLNRYNANRREAVKVCIAVDPKYASKGLECDEYPFASTYEGSAQSIYDETKPKKNFSARAIDGTENGAGGTQLASYYSDNRIIDGPNDEFYVVIIS
ncbi:NucA/NucB deoxyribonuclease domain-containing protein [Streptomyces sp. NPDC048324]|uniref:NucA/NucB deoxyribonuclease domain-containing protein n=1 Tax=Streptomyces sp. NPDC048324 TaxID=3157205 RepID=UPI003424B82B